MSFVQRLAEPASRSQRVMAASCLYWMPMPQLCVLHVWSQHVAWSHTPLTQTIIAGASFIS
jgi:hypothetical protein